MAAAMGSLGGAGRWGAGGAAGVNEPVRMLDRGGACWACGLTTAASAMITSGRAGRMARMGAAALGKAPTFMVGRGGRPHGLGRANRLAASSFFSGGCILDPAPADAPTRYWR